MAMGGEVTTFGNDCKACGSMAIGVKVLAFNDVAGKWFAIWAFTVVAGNKFPSDNMLIAGSVACNAPTLINCIKSGLPPWTAVRFTVLSGVAAGPRVVDAQVGSTAV